MFYTIYQITNNVNGKIYIGKHQTKDLNDGYMGSGKHLRHSQEKYGIENFTKKILFVFDNEYEMNAKEAELVTEEFCLREDTYNLCPGGHGGWGYLNMNGLNNHNKDMKVIAEKLRDQKIGVPQPHISLTNKKAYAEGRRKVAGAFSEEGRKEMVVRAQSEEAKTKRSITRKERNFQIGENNSQYGTTWIWKKEFGNKKIKKAELENYLSHGWEKTYKPGYKL